MKYTEKYQSWTCLYTDNYTRYFHRYPQIVGNFILVIFSAVIMDSIAKYWTTYNFIFNYRNTILTNEEDEAKKIMKYKFYFIFLK